MSDPNHTFWGAFAQRLRRHRPHPESDAGWASMRELLDSQPPAGPMPGAAHKGRWLILTLLMLGLAGAYWLHNPESPEIGSRLETPLSEVPAPAMNHASLPAGNTGDQTTSHTIAEIASGQDSAHEDAMTAASGPAKGPIRSTRKGTSASGSLSGQSNPLGSVTQALGFPGENSARAMERHPAASAPDNLPANDQWTPAAPAEWLLLPSLLGLLPIVRPGLPPGEPALPASRRAPGAGWILGLSVADPVPGAWQVAFSPVAGLYYTQPLADKWSLQAELLLRYTRLRDLRYQFRWEDISPQGEYRYLERSQALEGFFSLDLPILLHYRLHRRWHLEGGLRYSLILEQGSSGAISGNLTRSIPGLPGQMLWVHDAGISLGSAYHFAGGWSLHLRYTQGLRDLSPDDLYTTRRNHLNSNLQLHIQQNF
jgi:hypothetical protein